MTGLSALIGGLAFLGGLIFLAGIALVVVSVSQGRPARQGVLLAVIGLVVFIILSVVGNGILIVEPARAAVVVNILSGELEEPARPAGTSIIIPGIQEYVIYPIDQQEYTMSGVPAEGDVKGDDAVEALTNDGQVIYIDITVFYRIERENVNTVHLNWQNRYENEFIRPTVRSIVRDIISQFNAEAIYSANRDELQGEARARLEEEMATQGLTLTNMLVRRIRFSDQFAQSIEDKQIEQQRLQRAQTEAQRIETEQRGIANGQIEAARGRAESRLIEAQAEAEALALVSSQIAANPNLISYMYVQNLSDNVSLALIPSNTPYLFDLNSFEMLGEDFTVPEVPNIVPPNTNDTGTDGN